MFKKTLYTLFLSVPAPAFAAGLHSDYAGNNLIFMSFLTGFAIVALVQFGHAVLQGLRKEGSLRLRGRRPRS